MFARNVPVRYSCCGVKNDFYPQNNATRRAAMLSNRLQLPPFGFTQ
jgi:hypothetical protein